MTIDSGRRGGWKDGGVGGRMEGWRWRGGIVLGTYAETKREEEIENEAPEKFVLYRLDCLILIILPID